MATKVELLAQGYERISEQLIADWFEARAKAQEQCWDKGRAAMLVKEAGGWAIYALRLTSKSAPPAKQSWQWREEV